MLSGKASKPEEATRSHSTGAREEQVNGAMCSGTQAMPYLVRWKIKPPLQKHRLGQRAAVGCLINQPSISANQLSLLAHWSHIPLVSFCSDSFSLKFFLHLELLRYGFLKTWASHFALVSRNEHPILHWCQERALDYMYYLLPSSD